MKLYPQRPEVIELLRQKHVQKDGNPQTRRHGGPYFLHPIAVTEILYTRFGELRPHVLMASDMHDLIEDTETTYDEIKELYGEDVANIVSALSKPHKVRRDGMYFVTIDGVEYGEEVPKDKVAFAYYKTLQHAPPGAAEIKVADRIHNLSELKFTEARFQRNYLIDTALLITALCGAVPLKYLEALRIEYWHAAERYANA